MKPELVRFSSRPHPFWVKTTRCANPECACTDVTFHLREVSESDRAGAGPIVLQVRVDGPTWTEIEPPARSAEIARLVQEFLREYPAGEKAALQRACEEKRRIARRLKEYRIDPRRIEEGTLIAFGEITHDRAGGKADPASFAYEFEHEDGRYLVDDLYCANPGCACRKVHLVFAKCAPRAGCGEGWVAHDRFMATVTLDGRAEIEELHQASRSEAESLLAAWQERYAGDIEELRWRYEKVKEISGRSAVWRNVPLRRYDFAPEVPVPAAHRAGRNDPCPCGSGKKFKKCCGQNKDRTSRPR